MKQSLRYDQISCRLQLDGLPDVSAGQGSEAIGILSRWTLDWLGRPQLEGRREHLEALMVVVLPYARHLISGVPRSFGDAASPVAVEPLGEGLHRLTLRSSQPGVEPLSLQLDDAELADLVRVLDQVRLDPRLKLPLPLVAPRPLRHREIRRRTPQARRLAAPLGGALLLAVAAATASLLPLPKPPSGDPVPRREAAPAPAAPPLQRPGG